MQIFSLKKHSEIKYLYILRDILLKPKLIEKLVISTILFLNMQNMICSLNLVTARGEVVE